MSNVFSIESGELLYDGKKIEENNSYPFIKYCFKEELGRGANGIAYKVFHELLEVEQVIKVSKFSESEKNMLEAKKNANPRVIDAIAVVSDVGKLTYPNGHMYSVMSNVDNSVTLKEWLEYRDKILESEESLWILLQKSIDMCFILLHNYMKLYRENIVHGDLNLNNILVTDVLFVNSARKYLKDDTEKKINSFINTLSEISPGKVQTRNTNVKYIDLGTSHAKGTDRNVGKHRDCYFLIDCIRRLLKPIVTSGEKINNFLKILITDEGSRKEVRLNECEELAPIVIIEMLTRIVLFMNIVNGNLYNDTSVDFSKGDAKYISELSSIMFGEIDSRNLETDTLDFKCIELLEDITKLRKGMYTGGFIEWEKLWNMLSKRFKNKKIFN